MLKPITGCHAEAKISEIIVWLLQCDWRLGLKHQRTEREPLPLLQIKMVFALTSAFHFRIVVEYYTNHQLHDSKHTYVDVSEEEGEGSRVGAVSYTHLTLPTILLV